MSEQEFREKLARLRALTIVKDAQLIANPKPYMEDMSRRCGELLDVLEKVEYALSSDMVFSYWDENARKEAIRRPKDMNGEALIRCNAALEILRGYKGT